MYRIPRATYRVQFNAGFTFRDARAIAPYLAELGISDIYASPILKARRGSTHGYDVVDASALNPELGTEDDFTALHEELQRLGMGLLLDVVPNHMAASEENAWWMSVLENGPQSRFLHYFFKRAETPEKVLLPILGRPYGDTLESQEIRLGFDADGFYFIYYDRRLPLAPSSYRIVLQRCIESVPHEGVAIELRELVEGDVTVPNSRFLKETLWRIYEQDAPFREALDRAVSTINADVDALDALLDAQWYRLAYWRIASEKINYRRFFDVTDLVGLRVEDPEVFEARNRRTLELIAEGKVTGLRIDHIDGLFDPIGHMRKLQLRLGDDKFYVALEKILTHGEELPAAFPVDGTTGYDFLDAVNALFVDPAGLGELDDFYRRFTGVTQSFDDICYERKKQVIAELFSGEMRTLGKELAALALADRNARDFAPTELLGALTEVTACMRVYRTYIRNGGVSNDDRAVIMDAIADAQRRAASSLDPRLFVFLELVLLVEPPAYLAEERERWLNFVMRWQQFTGRVMAKGVEDTSFYNYNRLVSLNDVGGNPGRGSDFDPLAEFHAHNVRRQRAWPHTLNATSTHDTKRSEDVRARINVLSEMPAAWTRQVRRWSRMTAAMRRGGVPHPNEELLLYQTLVGAWPLDEARLKQYVEKAAREAKTNTSWIALNEEYERALLDFAGALLQCQSFRADFLRFQRRVAFHGFLNALSQTVLKATAPGVPDFYQGTELWDYSLVDPDNRRPVDYEMRASLLRRMSSGTDLTTLLRRWPDGRVKLYVTWKTLALRTRREALFRDGDYAPVDAGANVCAFTRSLTGTTVVVAVPRLTTQLTKPGVLPLTWPDASLPISGSWRNIFTGEELSGEALQLRNLFASFPVAVLEPR
ncbi:MAG TPA: malto-oligosyltrehalose synthase [Thermoanaerobaculia bacterium]|nr:malto-oligosyltrehalose synthase [Thermoanaerobaculia bacterium]